MPLQRRHSGGTTLDLEQFAHLEEIAEDGIVDACCTAPKDFLCLRGGEVMYESDLATAVKLICSNPDCRLSQFMHAECFAIWEETLLNLLKSNGKTRTWTEKQKCQSIWTKRGYELTYKACACNCQQGHLRKDFNYDPPNNNTTHGNGSTSTDSEGERTKRRRRKNSKNMKPALTIGLPTSLSMNNNNSNSNSHNQVKRSESQGIPLLTRIRTNSLSSNNSGSGSSTFSPLSSPMASPPSSDSSLPPRRANHLDRSRHDSGGSIFLRRTDYSSFNVLPKHKINSYHIKMEDECSIGNDETRCFILSSYATNRMNRVPCVLCGGLMHIFERYPLIDGTFFLSPRQHSKACIQVKYEGRFNFLSAVCMGCLEGWNTNLHCRFCVSMWDGSQLILGTMYSYDIFAAVPCCADRLKCTSCNNLVIHPEQRFNFFSDYSQTVSCPNCGEQDYHFTKSLDTFVSREDLSKAAANNQNVSRTWAAAVRS